MIKEKIKGFIGLISIIFFICINNINAQNESKINKTVQSYLQKSEFVQAKNYLDSLSSLYSENIAVKYNLALYYYSQKEFRQAKTELLDVIETEGVRDIHYQLLSRVYDLMEDGNKANEYIYEGIKKFSNSGALYYELGLINLSDNIRLDAIEAFEKGVYNDPKYDKNYYQLAKIYANSDNVIWSILYSEIFLNITIDVDKAREISKLLYESYQFAVKKNDDGLYFSFYLDEGSSNRINPFKYNFEKIFNSSAKEILKNKNNLYVDDLIEIRKSFLVNWYKSGYDIHYPNVLFDYQKKILDNSSFVAYSFSILSEGDQQALGIWYNNNKKEFSDYSKWSVGNPLKIDEKNKFTIKQYDEY